MKEEKIDNKEGQVPIKGSKPNSRFNRGKETYKGTTSKESAMELKVDELKDVMSIDG